MRLLGKEIYIQQPSYSSAYHIFVKFDKYHDELKDLTYNIGEEHDLIAFSAGCLFVNWEPLLKKYKFKAWAYPNNMIEFPCFKYKFEAERFVNLLNTHCLIQIK